MFHVCVCFTSVRFGRVLGRDFVIVGNWDGLSVAGDGNPKNVLGLDLGVISD